MREFMIDTFADLLVHVVLSLYFYHYQRVDITVLWWIWPLAWIVGTSYAVFFYLKKMNAVLYPRVKK